MNVRIWKRKLPLLTDASDDAMVRMASDIEPGGLALMRGVPESSLYI